uniref:ATP-dependent Clp protease proteolytic subunit n=1 Tax=Staurocarteria crucifera TaxID=47781 RepID=A0A0S2IC11_9CHLO|nr:proteolytic subunit 2 of clp protease [Carteria crucifera]
MPIGVPRIIYCWSEELPAQWTDIYNFIFRKRMIFLMQHLDNEICNQICGLLINIHMEDRTKDLDEKKMLKSSEKGSSAERGGGGTKFRRTAGISENSSGFGQIPTGSTKAPLSSKGQGGFGSNLKTDPNLTQPPNTSVFSQSGRAEDLLKNSDEDLAIDDLAILEQYTLQKITLEWLNWNAQFFDYADEPYLFYLAELLSSKKDENLNLLYGNSAANNFFSFREKGISASGIPAASSKWSYLSQNFGNLLGEAMLGGLFSSPLYNILPEISGGISSREIPVALISSSPKKKKSQALSQPLLETRGKIPHSCPPDQDEGSYSSSTSSPTGRISRVQSDLTASSFGYLAKQGYQNISRLMLILTLNASSDIAKKTISEYSNENIQSAKTNIEEFTLFSNPALISGQERFYFSNSFFKKELENLEIYSPFRQLTLMSVAFILNKVQDISTQTKNAVFDTVFNMPSGSGYSNKGVLMSSSSLGEKGEKEKRGSTPKETGASDWGDLERVPSFTEKKEGISPTGKINQGAFPHACLAEPDPDADAVPKEKHEHKDKDQHKERDAGSPNGDQEQQKDEVSAYSPSGLNRNRSEKTKMLKNALNQRVIKNSFSKILNDFSINSFFISPYANTLTTLNNKQAFSISNKTNNAFDPQKGIQRYPTDQQPLVLRENKNTKINEKVLGQRVLKKEYNQDYSNLLNLGAGLFSSSSSSLASVAEQKPQGGRGGHGHGAGEALGEKRKRLSSSSALSGQKTKRLIKNLYDPSLLAVNLSSTLPGGEPEELSRPSSSIYDSRNIVSPQMRIGATREYKDERIMRMIEEESENKLFVLINSFGGSVGNGITIHDAMQFIRGTILTVGLGVVASAASLALAGGTIGDRYITEACHAMIHQPEGGVSGQASDLWIESQEILKIRLNVAEIYSLTTYRPRHKVLRDLDRDFYLTASEACAYGLADYVATSAVMHEIIQATNSAWDYQDSKQQRLLEKRLSLSSNPDTQSILK